MCWIVRMDGKGGIVIPNEVRDKLGLKKGASLTLDIHESEIIQSPLEGRNEKRTGLDELKSLLSKH